MTFIAKPRSAARGEGIFLFQALQKDAARPARAARGGGRNIIQIHQTSQKIGGIGMDSPSMTKIAVLVDVPKHCIGIL